MKKNYLFEIFLIIAIATLLTIISFVILERRSRIKDNTDQEEESVIKRKETKTQTNDLSKNQSWNTDAPLAEFKRLESKINQVQEMVVLQEKRIDMSESKNSDLQEQLRSLNQILKSINNQGGTIGSKKTNEIEKKYETFDLRDRSKK